MKECRYTQHILKVHPGDFFPGQSTTGTRSGGSSLDQRTGVDVSENTKISSLMHIEPESSSPRELIKATPGVRFWVDI